MSLLMQALRKAESAKKNQGAAADTPVTHDAARPPDTGELTLEVKEPTREDIATAKEVAADAAAAGEAPVPVEAGPEPAVDYFSSEVPPARAPYVPAEAPADSGPQGFDPDRGFTATPAPAAPVAEVMPEPAPVRPPETAARLKLGMDQQKEADAARKTLEARGAAGSVFAAKIPVRNRRPWVIAAIGLLLLAGVGGYGYYQLTRIGQPASVASYPPAQVVVVPVAAPALPAPAPVLVAAPAVAPAAAVPAAVPAPAAAPLPAPVQAAPLPKAPRSTAPRAAPSSVPRPARDAAPIEFLRNAGSRQVNPTLNGAYQAFVAGDAASARSQYQRVLQQEPDNRDALLGMAAIAVNRGQASEAGSFYSRLLELDPSDAEAASGLASVQRGDPTQAESNLKKVLAASPQTGSAHFALGNVYAQQQRWPEAQQAYFQAVGATPANADYVFNLAVSLDKLGQKKLASDAYQRALQLAQHGGSGIDQLTVQQRIRVLRQEMAALPK